MIISKSNLAIKQGNFCPWYVECQKKNLLSIIHSFRSPSWNKIFITVFLHDTRYSQCTCKQASSEVDWWLNHIAKFRLLLYAAREEKINISCQAKSTNPTGSSARMIYLHSINLCFTIVLYSGVPFGNELL